VSPALQAFTGRNAARVERLQGYAAPKASV